LTALIYLLAVNVVLAASNQKNSEPCVAGLMVGQVSKAHLHLVEGVSTVVSNLGAAGWTFDFDGSKSQAEIEAWLQEFHKWVHTHAANQTPLPDSATTRAAFYAAF
jgi:hypothetical protein